MSDRFQILKVNNNTLDNNYNNNNNNSSITTISENINNRNGTNTESATEAPPLAQSLPPQATRRKSSRFFGNLLRSKQSQSASDRKYSLAQLTQ